MRFRGLAVHLGAAYGQSGQQNRIGTSNVGGIRSVNAREGDMGVVAVTEAGQQEAMVGDQVCHSGNTSHWQCGEVRYTHKDVGVTGYDVYTGSSLATSVTATSATVTGLAPDTQYTFTVKARDAAGNASEASEPVTARTQPGAGRTLGNETDFPIRDFASTYVRIGSQPNEDHDPAHLRGRSGCFPVRPVWPGLPGEVRRQRQLFLHPLGGVEVVHDS